MHENPNAARGRRAKKQRRSALYFVGSSLGGSFLTLPPCATHARKYSRSAWAVPVRLPATAGGWALTVSSRHFFATSTVMADADCIVDVEQTTANTAALKTDV